MILLPGRIAGGRLVVAFTGARCSLRLHLVCWVGCSRRWCPADCGDGRFSLCNLVLVVGEVGCWVSCYGRGGCL
jgi:hypothetical protein